MQVRDDHNKVTLEEDLCNLAIENIFTVLSNVNQNNFVLLKQNNEASTYCKKIIKQDSLINFEMSSDEIYNKFRAYYEWPGIAFEHKNTIVKIKGMYVLDKNNTFLDNEKFKFDKSKLIIKTTDKAIVITHLQFPGKRTIGPKDVYNSYKSFFFNN